MTRLPALLLLPIALSLSVACGTGAEGPDPEPGMEPDAAPDPEPAIGPNTPVTLEVGIGFYCFDPYVDGQPILLQHGWQGGQHLNTTVIATGLEAFADDTLRMWAEDPAGEVIAGITEITASFEPPVDLEPAPPEGSVVMRGPYLFVPEADPLLDAETVTLHIEVLTGDGRKGAWSATGDVVWMPDDYAEQVGMWCAAEPDPQGGLGGGDG
jgi:hypothetical protein